MQYIKKESKDLTSLEIKELAKHCYECHNHYYNDAHDYYYEIISGYKQRKNTGVVIAYDENKIVGCIFLLDLTYSNAINHSDATKKYFYDNNIDQSKCAFVALLWINPSYDGMGIATELTKKSEKMAIEKGFKYFFLFGFEQKGSYSYYKNYYSDRLEDTNTHDPFLDLPYPVQTVNETTHIVRLN